MRRFGIRSIYIYRNEFKICDVESYLFTNSCRILLMHAMKEINVTSLLAAAEKNCNDKTDKK